MPFYIPVLVSLCFVNRCGLFASSNCYFLDIVAQGFVLTVGDILESFKLTSFVVVYNSIAT